MNIDWKKLINAARKVRLNAYARYSDFKVGAAVLGKSGKIYTGCNVENASYSITICAERSAIANAIANGENEIVAVAVIADSQPITPPCGACRQFIQEFGPHALVKVANLNGQEKTFSQEDMLPYPFTYSMLKKKKRKTK